MKKIFKKYGGIIFFYTTIVMMVWIVTWRFNYLNQIEKKEIAYMETLK